MTDLAERAVARLSEIDDAIQALEHERGEISTALRVLSTLLESNSSTAALKEVQERPIAKPGLTAASVNGDSLRGEGETTAPAGTQAPPVETIQEPVALHPTDPLRSGAAEGNEADLPAPETRKRPAAPGTLRFRIEADLAEHPNSTAREIAARLGVPQPDVSSLAKHHDLPIRKMTPEELSELRRSGGRQGGLMKAGKTKAASEKKLSRQEHRKVTGEYIETTSKRSDVASLHAAEPWLTPEEASSRLNIPIGNLRTFTQELDLAWGQGERPQPPVADKASKKIDRIRLVHSQHPTWTARMIANHLGEKQDTVSTLLAIVRREEVQA